MFNIRFLRRTEEDVEIKKGLEGPQNELGSGNSAENVMEYLPAPLLVPSVGFDWEPTTYSTSLLKENFPLLTEGLPEAPVIQGRLDHSR
jgi:hypothetical protein